MDLASRLAYGRVVVGNLGLYPTLHYAMQRLRSRWLPQNGFRVRSKYTKFPLWCRGGTSDKEVWGQIFVRREYRCLDFLVEAALVIDCGANVGFASAYFLSRFRNARVIAVEPDHGNFDALLHNLQPWKGRFDAIRKGIWSHRTGLVISEEKFGDGREWAVTVRECQLGELPTLEAIDIASLIPEGQRVSILKVDIEGAERYAFSGNCDWLDRVDNLVIELHGADCEEIFLRAIAGRGFQLSHCDELLVCTR